MEKVPTTDNTPYDDVFRTLLNDCLKLVLPVLNEVFGEEYTGEEEIIFHQNEHFLNKQNGVEERRITDSSFTVKGKQTKSYLFECQSTPDASMLVRMFEYATQIALDNGIQNNQVLEVTIPHSTVLFLRSTTSTPDKMQIVINTPGGSVSYDIPVIKIKNYKLTDIVNKNLLFLLPFFIFNFDNRQLLKSFNENQDELNKLLNTYKQIMKYLETLMIKHKIDSYYGVIICDMMKKVIDKFLSNYENIKKGVESIMGGKILDHAANQLIREGKLENLIQNITALIKANMCDFDTAFKTFNVPIDQYDIIKKAVNEKLNQDDTNNTNNTNNETNLFNH